MALRLGTLGLGAAPRSNHTHLCECWCSLKKEVKSYYKEATKQEAKIAKMRESGADSHDINKQVRRWSQVTAFLNSTSRACVCVCVCVCVCGCVWLCVWPCLCSRRGVLLSFGFAMYVPAFPSCSWRSSLRRRT